MAAFSIDETTVGAATVVRLIGSADLSGQAILEHEVNRLAAVHPTLVVLDFSQLTFIASLAVGQLVMLQHAIRRRGGHVRLANPTDDVRTVLVRCKLTDLLPIYPSVQAAAEAPR
ncbi:MAG: STAS domain-containing protein [Phycisphaerae bacterium]|nr:STAS domain-containing protein [Phycisphaerae bacterium]